MSLTKDQQIRQLLLQSQRILILLPENATGDHYATASAWSHFFSTLGKEMSVAGATINLLRERHQFLTPPTTTLTSLSGLRDFVLSFNTKYNRILGTRTEIDGDEYKIFVTPEKGSLDPRDFSILPVHFAYDCLVILGAPDRESLGALAEENPDIFYEIPVINIDRRPDNEAFGQINFIDITASSLAEISNHIFSLFSDRATIDELTAECLLAGIMIATDSFQKKTATPKAFQLAAHLIDQGADQQKLVQHLFKTQPFHILKLWGQIMATLHWEEPAHILVSSITPQDLIQSGATETDIPLAIEKIHAHTSDASSALFFASTPSTTSLFLHIRNQEQKEKIRFLLAHTAKSVHMEGDMLIATFDKPSTDIQTLLLDTILTEKK